MGDGDGLRLLFFSASTRLILGSKQLQLPPVIPRLALAKVQEHGVLVSPAPAQGVATNIVV